MAQNITIMGASYSAVPAVTLRHGKRGWRRIKLRHGNIYHTVLCRGADDKHPVHRERLPYCRSGGRRRRRV